MRAPVFGAMITITVPHTALDGDSGPPGEVAGFGITDHADTRDLVAAAARNPATRWCVTVLDPDGTAAAHGCRGPDAASGRQDTGRQNPSPPATCWSSWESARTHPGHPRTVRPRPGRAPLPAQPQAPAPDPGPQHHLHRTRLRPQGRPVRPGPHRPSPSGRPYVRVQPCPSMPSSPHISFRLRQVL